MAGKILLNTGIYVKTDISDSIRLISEHQVDGIELGCSFLDILMNFRLSQESFGLLKNFSVKGLHAPVNFQYRNDKYTQDVLQKLKQVASLVDAQYVVFHAHSIQDFALFKDYGISCALENDRDVYKMPAAKLKALVEKLDMKFVLDTSHAMSFSDKEVGDLVNALGDRIVAVHLSVRHEGRDHTPLHMVQDLKPIDAVRKLKVPFVLECWHTYKDSIAEEIKFVRKWLR